MKVIKALLSIAVTLLLIWVLETKFGNIPPAGAFLNPSTGFWQNAESKHILATENIKLRGLQGKVVIRYDENRIPHIFAENDHDLYYAQGYVTARDRLWQMDVQTRSAFGQVSRSDWLPKHWKLTATTAVWEWFTALKNSLRITMGKTPKSREMVKMRLYGKG